MDPFLHTRRYLLVLSLLVAAVSVYAQERGAASGATVQRFVYTLGSSRITLKKTTFAPGSRFFIVLLHDNENTAEKAAIAFLNQHGGTLLSIENGDKRLIRFATGNRSWVFDPNRIFTSRGLRQNLRLFRSYSPANAKAIAGFRAFILRQVPRSAMLIAVHNNTEDQYSVHSYKNPKALRHQAAQVHINPQQDKDHFFVTTAHGIFKKLQQAGYNTVLQHWQSAADDGSLSYYCSRHGRRYVNVEAEAGAFSIQLQMLQDLKRLLE